MKARFRDTLMLPNVPDENELYFLYILTPFSILRRLHPINSPVS